MKKTPQEPGDRVRYGSPDDVERAFYRAFSECDTQRMSRVWAEDDVICIHPGSTLLRGRAAVLQSWVQILGGASRPSVRVQTISRVQHRDLAVHVVEERITPGGGSSATASVVLATNVFRLIADAWYLIEHHASLPLVNTDPERPDRALH